eukprot:scaffold518_cov388-Prasinococcus_capsulatus_cf.AAC.52
MSRCGLAPSHARLRYRALPRVQARRQVVAPDAVPLGAAPLNTAPHHLRQLRIQRGLRLGVSDPAEVQGGRHAHLQHVRRDWQQALLEVLTRDRKARADLAQDRRRQTLLPHSLLPQEARPSELRALLDPVGYEQHVIHRAVADGLLYLRVTDGWADAAG